MPKPNSIPPQPEIPRFGDIQTVVGLDLRDANTNIGFRSWLNCQGVSIQEIERDTDPECKARWLAKYSEYLDNDHRYIDDKYNLMDHLAHEWKYNRGEFVKGVFAVLCAGVLLVLVFLGPR